MLICTDELDNTFMWILIFEFRQKNNLKVAIFFIWSFESCLENVLGFQT